MCLCVSVSVRDVGGGESHHYNPGPPDGFSYRIKYLCELGCSGRAGCALKGRNVTEVEVYPFAFISNMLLFVICIEIV